MSKPRKVYLLQLYGLGNSAIYATYEQAKDALESYVKDHVGPDTELLWHNPGYASWTCESGTVTFTSYAHITRYDFYDKED